ncbi:TorD/DmsD family molecular chaperone [Paenibacillus pini]|uniref:Oxidoreductase n=1 Tax=Paenibacillus pini JCM 16418 TaxID=1236976 RepID=W7YZQ7_9BACL|nr:molecular chaperone TorD family protein [Paenibacillus pini]GAF10151.1 oxidoreductase [Paenibacillus pini JCM 16418]
MMTMTAQSVHESAEGVRWLQGRGWMYQLLIDFLENPPSLSQMMQWQLHIVRREEVVLTESVGQLKAYIGGLKPVQLLNLCSEETAEYHRLFDSMDAVLPCVCESVYREEDHGSMLSCIQQIRKAYADCGIVFNKLDHEKDDHITLELEFMAVMGERAQDSSRFADHRLVWVDHQIDFLENHLMKWTPQLANEMQQLAQTPLYTGLARILKEFIPYDLNMLREWRKELA